MEETAESSSITIQAPSDAERQQLCLETKQEDGGGEACLLGKGRGVPWAGGKVFCFLFGLTVFHSVPMTVRNVRIIWNIL